MFLWKIGYRSNHTEIPRGKHEIFSTVIPSIPSLLPSSNFLGEKVKKDDRELTQCFLPIIFLFLGVEMPQSLVEDRILRLHPRRHKCAKWDLIYNPWRQWEEWSWCWAVKYRLAPKVCRKMMMVWQAKQLTCVNQNQNQKQLYNITLNIQTTTVKHVQYINKFMTGYKFLEQHTYVHTGWPWHRPCLHRYLALKMCLWHLNGLHLSIQPANLLFSTHHSTAHCWWVRRGNKMGMA